VVEIAFGLIERGLRLLIGREFFERQLRIAQELVQRGVALLDRELRLQLSGD
jgi:hypothetical protein